MVDGIFFAYPASPSVVGDTIERAISYSKQRGRSEIGSWRELDIPGHFISSEVLQKIDESSILFADISRLNFNVVYEIGYAIGRSKRVFLVRNNSISEEEPTIKDVGVDLPDFFGPLIPGKRLPVWWLKDTTS